MFIREKRCLFLRVVHLFSRHSVPKLTPDSHMNIEFWISGGPELGQKPIKSRSKYYAYRGSHDSTQTRHSSTKMWIFIVIQSAGHMKASRREQDVYTTPFCRNWILTYCDLNFGSYTRFCSVELLRLTEEDALRMLPFIGCPRCMGNPWTTQ